jgi:hypothetical protein
MYPRNQIQAMVTKANKEHAFWLRAGPIKSCVMMAIKGFVGSTGLVYARRFMTTSMTRFPPVH